MAKKTTFKLDIPKLLISLVGPLLAGALGSIATASSIPTWYADLTKPPFNPPNWVFGPVWTVLYLLMGIALYIVWTRGKEGRNKRLGMLYFWIQLTFNLVWSFVFFGSQSLLGGLAIILLLLLFISLTMVYFKRISKLAFALLIPYLMWVTFATILNLSLFLLN